MAALEHAAAQVAPDWARTMTSIRRAEALQRRAERARGLRDGIVSAAAALAAITEESPRFTSAWTPAVTRQPIGSTGNG